MQGNGCLILSYHHIAEAQARSDLNRFYVTPKNFESQMNYLKKGNFCVLELRELVHAIDHKLAIPRRAVVLTFDDGYKSFMLNAKDILASHGFKASIFIATAKVGGVDDWDEDGQKVNDNQIMSWDDIRSLAKAGFSFYSHTANHPRLPDLTDEAILDELTISRQALEFQLGQKEHLFCYPFSAFDDRIARLVKSAGYLCACTTLPGINYIDTDVYFLRRIDVLSSDFMARFIYRIHYYRFCGRRR